MSNARTLAGFKPSTLGTLATKSTVLTSDITDLTIATADIADNAVTTAKIPDSAITTGKLPDAAVTNAKLAQPFTAGTAVSASGTAVDFTGIPSWAKRIVVALSGVSTSGTSFVRVRLGTSAGFEATGYASVNDTFSTTLSPGLITDGLPCVQPLATAAVWNVAVTIHNISGNSWMAVSQGGRTDVAGLTLGSGSKTLAGVLDRLRITMVNGTDTFDAGTINIFYE